jgi:lysyl-tRNA synthetase class 2
MADSSVPTEDLTNLQLDEVTGEKVSKSELKRRNKQREKDAKKAEREAAAPPKPVKEKKSNAEAEEKELNPNVPPLSLPALTTLLTRRV